MTKFFGNKYVKGITQFIQDEHFGPRDYIDWYCEQMGLSREEYMAGYRIAMDLRLARVQESKDRDWNDPKPGPDPYETGLDDEEIEDKEAQMKKQAKMDDDDPDAYKEMPGDAEAREEGKVKTSTHTKKYHELYGDDEANEAVSESERVYIDFLNKDKNFKQDRKYFKSWDDAVKWARKNFDKFSPDMISYESFQLTETDDVDKKSTDRGPLEDDAMETGLKKKADESGVPIGIIRAVARRGLAAWRTGHRPGATQQQWAYARVNSFLTKQPGTWGGADKDLAKEVRDGGHDKKLKKA